MAMHSMYYFCAVLGSAFVVFSFITLLLGLGGDGDSMDGGDGGDASGGDGGDTGDADGGDADSAAHHDGGLGFLRAFSVRSVAAGLAFFGIAGLTAENAKCSVGTTLAIAIGVGFIAMYLVYRLVRMMSSFNHNGALVKANLVGAEGTVYLRIPAKRGGIGKASVVHQEQLVEYPAMTDDEEDLQAGLPIVVVSLQGKDVLLVSKLTR